MVIVAAPLPIEVVICGSDFESGRIFVEMSIDPAAQSAFKVLAKGK
jgi:hypothetical protein